MMAGPWEKDIRRLEKTLEDLLQKERTRAAQRPPLDWFEPFDHGACAYTQLGAANDNFIACPLHLPAPILVRGVTFLARSAGGGGGGVGEPEFSAAFYRALRPAAQAGRELAPSPAFFRLQLLVPIGKFNASAPSNELAIDRVMSSEFLILPETYAFIVIRLGDFTNTEILARAGDVIGPHMAFRCEAASDLPVGSSAWPDELMINRSARERCVYFALRSSYGLRVYGDGLQV